MKTFTHQLLRYCFEQIEQSTSHYRSVRDEVGIARINTLFEIQGVISAHLRQECDYEGEGKCEHRICVRCGGHGDSSACHFQSFCSLTESERDKHHCCPGDCALADSAPEVIIREALDHHRRVVTPMGPVESSVAWALRNKGLLDLPAGEQ